MTQKYDQFIRALRALCEEHEVSLSPDDCGHLCVWDYVQGDELLRFPGFSDETDSKR
jgi:hypothetical protein